MTEILVLAIFPTLVILAAFNDLFTMKIPNWISVLLLLGFAVLAPICGISLSAVGLHLLVGALALIIGFGLFSANVIGGGDAKLIAAVALWAGWPEVVPFLLTTGIFGGVLAMMVLSIRHLPLPVGLVTQPWIQRLTDKGGGIPYGVAIAVGALAVYPDTVWMHVAG